MLERMWSKGKHIPCGGNANLCSHFGNQCGGFSGNWESIYLRTLQFHSWNIPKTYPIILPMHFFNYVHSSTICNRQNMKTTQVSLNRRMVKVGVEHVHIGIYSAVKNNDILNFACKWMHIENALLSEVSQTQKEEHGMYSLISGF